MRIDVLTLFPEAIEPFCAASIVGRAQESGLVRIVCTNFRDFATDNPVSDNRKHDRRPGLEAPTRRKVRRTSPGAVISSAWST